MAGQQNPLPRREICRFSLRASTLQCIARVASATRLRRAFLHQTHSTGPRRASARRPVSVASGSRAKRRANSVPNDLRERIREFAATERWKAEASGASNVGTGPARDTALVRISMKRRRPETWRQADDSAARPNKQLRRALSDLNGLILSPAARQHGGSFESLGAWLCDDGNYAGKELFCSFFDVEELVRLRRVCRAWRGLFRHARTIK
eukprot:scaffold7358_cov252-Pinguiococcus_pyrenoidosus.AAC.40